jgi:hypothetical protein
VDFYPDDPPPIKTAQRVRCPKCGEPTRGYYYCFACRRDHAESARAYMQKRRQDPNFVTAERAATRLRMRRWRARQRFLALGGDR